MRSEDEIRTALVTLERTLGALRFPTPLMDVLRGEIAALRYVLNEEEGVQWTMAEMLAKNAAVFAEADAELVAA